MNSELVKLLVELVIGSAVIMGVIAAACVLTPRLAKLLSKNHPEWLAGPARVEDGSESGTAPEVKGAYDAQHEDYDLNYKIYNTDIYGVDFKHGKEKRKKG
ncbi:MAG: hypothetical protein IJ746_02335 [Ruminococcus sp.]|nr:hypothetical protein [Ruminococcus sp.]